MSDSAAPPEPSRPTRINATHLKILYTCERQFYLEQHARGEKAEVSEFNRGLRQQGIDHERGMRAMFHDLVGPIYKHDGRFDEAVSETLRYLRESRAALYQPAFLSADGLRSGVPDFVYWEGDALIVCDAKLSTNLTARGDLHLQMAHYRALIEASSGHAIERCEILNGAGEFVTIEPTERALYETQVARALELVAPGPEPTLLKAHSKCQSCGFYEHCWAPAIEAGRLEVLPGVRGDAIAALHDAGLETIHDVVRRGAGAPAVHGVKPHTLDRIRQESQAWVEQRAVWIAPHGLPTDRPIVWFDLEGDPGNESEVPVYLWGAALDAADDRIDYLPVFAEPGLGGDRTAWERFLAHAADVFARHPNAVWVHFSDYEKTWTRKYIERHGDRGGVAARILIACFDLLPALRHAAVLPLRSYSIKAVAPWLGFEWSHPDMGSQWSTVQYLKARASDDPAERQRLFDDLAAYNRDDLLAMKRIWDWMEREGPDGPAPVVKSRRPRRRR